MRRKSIANKTCFHMKGFTSGRTLEALDNSEMVYFQYISHTCGLIIEIFCLFVCAGSFNEIPLSCSLLNATNVFFADIEMNEDVNNCSETEDAEERELEKAYQNVHVNVCKCCCLFRHIN